MTQETEDVVGRLRLFGSARPQLGLPVCDEAADLLERLSDRIDVLEEVVREVDWQLNGLAEAMRATGDYATTADAVQTLLGKVRAALHQEGIEEGSDDDA